MLAMNRTEKRELLSAYANGELARTQREFVEGHLDGCADCRAALEDFTWVRHRLTTLREGPKATSIKEATMSTITAQRPMRIPVEKLVRPALAAAAVLAAVLIPVVLLLSGSGPGSRIAEASDVFAGLDSYRMSGTTVFSARGETSESRFEWEFVAPDRYRGSITTADETTEFIVIGEEQYSKSPERPGGTVTVTTIVTDSIFTPVPSREGTLRLLDSLTGLKDLGDEMVGGADSRHYLGRVDIDRIIDEQAAVLDPDAPNYADSLAFLDLQRTMRFVVELWVSKEDSTVRQLKVEVESPTTGSGGKLLGTSAFSTLVRYSDFNVDLDIGPPVAPSGDLEPGWRASRDGPPQPTVTVTER